MADITEHLAEIAKILSSSGYHTAAANTHKAIEEIERLRTSLQDIINMQPMWHGGVGPMPREHLLGLIEGMKSEASAALAGQ